MKYTCVIVLCLMLNVGTLVSQEKQQNNFEDWKNKPSLVSPETKTMAPSDAIVLYSNNLDQWQFVDGSQINWPASEKRFKIVSGTSDIQTKQSFGDCQLHLEWRIDKKEDHGKSLNWGNSGVFFMGLYEVQVYDSYKDKNKIYYNGQAAAIYKQHAPLVNACKKPGKWETYDIVFNAPNFHENGTLRSPAYFTVFHNGILVQNHVEVKGATSHGKYTEYKMHVPKLPLRIQSHGAAVEYRNIWLREL